MMKRCQHITKLQSELIQEKKFIDCKLNEAIAKHCYLKKSKYELLLQVVIPKIPSYLKFTKLEKIPNNTKHSTHDTTLHTIKRNIT